MIQRLSHYAILDQIGAGGMGVVYRARDERLEREVAIKVLPAGMLADPAARARLAREAKSLSRLNHPNIATVHDFDSDAGTDFIVMEWVAGPTLEGRAAGGAIPEAELLPIAQAIAEGLAYAHSNGVAHRDLKPANLRLTPDGRVKILDFGLARRTWTEEGATAAVTESSATAGTLAYMPPEAFDGHVGDERGDLYSFGVVLYELSTGLRPFEGATTGQLVHSILQQPVVPPRARRASVSAGLETLILHLVERLPARRPASAREVVARIEALRAGGGTARPADARPSLAVLPLENLSGDPAQEYFVDGMTEMLIGDLARLRELRVISRTSVMRYKGARRPIPEIAAELRVESVLEGSVLRGGDRLRVSLQLIDARTDTHLWTERYDRPLTDVLALQSEIAETVARAIREALVTPDDASGAPASATASASASASSAVAEPQEPAANVEAYDTYLRGLEGLHRRDDGGLKRAAAHFAAALRLAPHYLPAFVGYAEAVAVRGFHEFDSPRDTFPVAREYARRAIELDARRGEAHAVLGYVQLHYDWNREAAEASFLRAIELNPSHSISRIWYTNLLQATARFDEGVLQARQALELDPFSRVARMTEGWVRFFARDFERAAEEMVAPFRKDRDFFQAFVWNGWALQALGRRAAAAESFETALAIADFPPVKLLCEVSMHGMRGRAAEANDALRRMIALRARHHVSPFLIALGHLAVEDRDNAMKWLATAAEERSLWIGYLDVDARVDPLRDDPRFALIRARVVPAV